MQHLGNNRNETREVPWWQLCRHGQHRRLSEWQPPVPPVTAKLPSWQLSSFGAVYLWGIAASLPLILVVSEIWGNITFIKAFSFGHSALLDALTTNYAYSHGTRTWLRAPVPHFSVQTQFVHCTQTPIHGRDLANMLDGTNMVMDWRMNAMILQ